MSGDCHFERRMLSHEPTLAEPQWYAIQTRSRHEKTVANQLQKVGVINFLPLVNQVHRWSDRRKVVQLPLFPGYVFVRIFPSPEERVRVVRVDGVVSLVGVHGEGTPIPDSQIESVRTLINNVPCVEYPFLKIGQRVRVRGGCLDGVEGILVGRNGSRTLVISVEPIQRSLAIRVEGYDIQSL
jgi:transcription antitermination factor NusG